MDPPHVTEFASPRYFDKFRQFHGQPQDAFSHNHQDSPSSAPFVLPIRDAEQVSHESQRTEKRRANFSFRTILPTRPSVDHESRRLSTDSSRKKSTPFDQLFLALPNELKIQIIASLPLSDILSLRIASRSWHAMITYNEFPIARYHLQHNVPVYATKLYPVPDPSAIRLHYLCGIWHRLHVAAKLSFLISERVTKEIFLKTTDAQRAEWAPQQERMRRRLIPLLFTLFHFFETYRAEHVQYIKEHGHGLSLEPYTMNPVELKVMSMYDDRTLLRVHEVFPLVVSSFSRRLRPPSYVGRFERSLRGYFKDKPADEVYATTLLVGGLRQVERFWEIKGYNTRRGAVDSWYQSVIKEPLEATSKQRRGFMGISRKKSTFNVHDTDRIPEHANRGRRGSENGRRASDASTVIACENFVFDTSLSEGMPMEPLSRDSLRLLLPDLPDLHSIWCQTAEALILERGIVERASDIKRGGPMVLDLVRGAGIAEEDEWWYGCTPHETVRPPLEAIEEDPIE